MTGPFSLERALIGVSGPEAHDFLQNLLTQNLDALARDGIAYGALLTPQGKVVTDMMLWAANDGAIVIEADLTRADDLARKLALYKLRAKVDLARLDETLGVLVHDAPFDGAVADPRLPALGYRALVSRDAAALRADGALDVFQQRVKLGVPDLAHDAAAEEIFALEGLMDELNGVDFQKGCFVGQENVSRMKRRATTRKKFCPIIFDGPPPAFGAIVHAGAAELGTVRSGIEGRALALLRLDRAQEAIAAGQLLTVADRAVRLDPPSWLLMPQGEAA